MITPPEACALGAIETPPYMSTDNWFAVETRPRSELTALADITALGLEAYVPQETRIRRTRKGKEVVQHPLLPGFIFVFACAKSLAFSNVLKSRAVRNVLREPGGEPQPIRPKIIDGWPVHFVDEMRAREAAGDFDFTPRKKPDTQPARFQKGDLKELMAMASRALFPGLKARPA